MIGTGAKGQLPILADVTEEAARRGVVIEAMPTREACELLSYVDPDDVYAILDVTCGRGSACAAEPGRACG